MKLFKRNAIILTVIMFVCVAVYLNWQYNRDPNAQLDADTPTSVSGTVAGGYSDGYGGNYVNDTTGSYADEHSGEYQPDGVTAVQAPANGDALFFGEQETVLAESGQNNYSGALPVSVGEYFADARLARQQARDSAVSIHRETAESSAASQTVKDEAIATISAMADYSYVEAQIESMIRARDFSECVVFLTDTSVTVTVPAPLEGLSEAAVARITDVVLDQTQLGYDQIKIVEVK